MNMIKPQGSEFADPTDTPLSHAEVVQILSQQIADNLCKIPNFSYLLSKCDGPLGQLEDRMKSGESTLIGISFFAAGNREGTDFGLTPHIEPLTIDESGERKMLAGVQSQPLRLYRSKDEDLRVHIGQTRQQIIDTLFDGLDKDLLRLLFIGEITKKYKSAEASAIHYLHTDATMPHSHPEFIEDRRRVHQRSAEYIKGSLAECVQHFKNGTHFQGSRFIATFFDQNISLIQACMDDEQALDVLLEKLSLELAEKDRIERLAEEEKVIAALAQLADDIRTNQASITIDPEQPTLMASRLPKQQLKLTFRQLLATIYARIPSFRLPLLGYKPRP